MSCLWSSFPVWDEGIHKNKWQNPWNIDPMKQSLYVNPPELLKWRNALKVFQTIKDIRLDRRFVLENSPAVFSAKLKSSKRGNDFLESLKGGAKGFDKGRWSTRVGTTRDEWMDLDQFGGHEMQNWFESGKPYLHQDFFCGIWIYSENTWHICDTHTQFTMCAETRVINHLETV